MDPVRGHVGAALLLLTALALAFTTGSGLAKTVGVTPTETVATVEFPDSWRTSSIARGIQAHSPDEEVYVWFELVGPAELDRVQKEHEAYFRKQGVKFTGPSSTERVEVKGKTWAFTSGPATYENGPTLVRYVAMNPDLPNKKIVLMTYWASPKGDKLYDRDMRALLSSFTTLSR